jgi:hypothetical protein
MVAGDGLLMSKNLWMEEVAIAIMGCSPSSPESIISLICESLADVGYETDFQVFKDFREKVS